MGARSRNSSHRARAPRAADHAPQEEPASSGSPGAQLRAWGLRPRKRFSQSFLTDRGTAESIVRSAKLSDDDVVLEIGPGLGILTGPLTQQAGRVVAVELDRDLAARLPSVVTAPNLETIAADALSFDPASLETDRYKLVANLPYHLTSPLLMRYLHDVQRPQQMTVMVQREVADRITARPGELSYLSIAIQSVAAVRVVRQVPPNAFYPRPRVSSTVLELRLRDDPVVPPDEAEKFLEFVRAGFEQPRKRLANSLAQGLSVPKSEIEPILVAEGLDESVRPHEISMETWRSLAVRWREIDQ